MELLLIRHAKSSWDDPSLADHARPLNQRGHRDASRMGRFLASLGLFIDVLGCSDSLRTQETLAGLAKGGWSPALTVLCPTLYHADAQTLMHWAMGTGRKQVGILAHNPGLEELVSNLAGRAIRFPTCCSANLTNINGQWQLMWIQAVKALPSGSHI